MYLICMKLFHVLLLLFLSVHYTSAATVQGNVYDEEFEKLDHIIIVVDTTPVQRFVALNGSYFFELPPGHYRLSARTFGDDMVLGTDEPMIIAVEGPFRKDLILHRINETNVGIEEIYDKGILDGKVNLVIIAALVLLVLTLVLIFFLFRKKTDEDVDDALDENARNILEFVRAEKRINQKDIRKYSDLSEAKISLIITELKEKGYIDKIKKGRGNIIIYNGKKH